MSDVKVAIGYIHVPKADGTVAVLEPGQVIPEDLAGRVTNPDAFVYRDEGTPSDEAIAKAAAAQAEVDEQARVDEATRVAEAAQVAEAAKVAADAIEAKAAADAAALAAAGHPAEPEPNTTGLSPEIAAAIAAEDGEHSALAFPALQARVKARGLKADGNTQTLVARLEAHDRDLAADNQ